MSPTAIQQMAADVESLQARLAALTASPSPSTIEPVISEVKTIETAVVADVKSSYEELKVWVLRIAGSGGAILSSFNLPHMTSSTQGKAILGSLAVVVVNEIKDLFNPATGAGKP